MKSSFIKGEWYKATPQNTEGLIPGKAYKCVTLGDSPDVAWIDAGNGEQKVVYMAEPSNACNDVEPLEVNLPCPKADANLVKHQKDVTRTALNMISREQRFTHGPISVVGGAPRDWDFNIPAQDIDIWLRNETFGDQQYLALKRIFEPEGATVKKVTNNDYARDGEYIHYIYNVVWQGVDLQFIFVEDSSPKAVIAHVCCNFSEISWDWQLDRLEPTHRYKAGRMARVLTFDDDKGRSPRDNYIAKMAARYPDHQVALPESCGHLESTYGSRCIPRGDVVHKFVEVADGSWGNTRFTVNTKTGLPNGKPEQTLWVVANANFDAKHPLNKNKPYKVVRMEDHRQDRLWVENGGDTVWYNKSRFRNLEDGEMVAQCIRAGCTPFERDELLVIKDQKVGYCEVLKNNGYQQGWLLDRFKVLDECTPF